MWSDFRRLTSRVQWSAASEFLNGYFHTVRRAR
jgi:hypothetical protein